VLADDVLTEVAGACRLREGPEGVRSLLRAVHEHGRIALRDAAVEIGLPVPVAAAVRRELEKRGLLARQAGMTLTDLGAAYVQGELAFGESGELVCPVCEGRHIVLGPTEEALIGRVRKLFAARPEADVTLDQSHNTAESAVRRLAFMAHKGAIAGRALVFLGDDDLMSVTVAVGARQLRLGLPKRVCAVDVDDRLLAAIFEVSRTEGLGIECIRHDLRCPLPGNLHGAFDVFFTDPPYTLDGATLFASRGAEALCDEPMKQGFLSFARKDPCTLAELHVRLGQMGFAVSQVIPSFTDYEGAAILGGTSEMIHLASSGRTKPYFAHPLASPIYTADSPDRVGRRGGPAASRRSRGKGGPE